MLSIPDSALGKVEIKRKILETLPTLRTELPTPNTDVSNIRGPVQESSP